MRVGSWSLMALLFAAGLAGCLAGDGDDQEGGLAVDHGPGFEYDALDERGLPVPVLLCFPELDGDDDTGQPMEGTAATRCNLEMTPDEGREGNEVTIAVNPTDPRNIVGGAKDYYAADAGECVWDGIYVTHDGGRTAFQDRSFDGSPWRVLQGDPENFQPNYASSFWCTTDPVAYFDVNGNLYYLLMAYQTDPVTGSKAGEDVLPLGALNDWAFNRATQIVAVSDDGGDTFHTFTPVFEGTFPIDFHDKGWIAASADGTIHVMWVAFLLPGNLYFRSTDGGQTFSDPEILSLTAGQDVAPDVGAPDPAPGLGDGPSGQGSFVDVGTGSQVYALWAAGDQMQMRRSFDTGSTFDEQRSLQGINGATMPGLESRDRRGGWPALATDRNPASPLADSLYIVWQDECQDDTWSDGCTSEGSAMWAISSFDEGETWTEPVRITDFHDGTEWNIFPTVSVSPGGVIDVSWMSTRGVTETPCHDGAPSCGANYGDAYPHLTQYYAYSLDGGLTWSRDFHVRQDADDEGWDPALCHHQNGMVFIGDYNDIDSSWQGAHPVWPDSRLGVCDVFTATIQRPMFAAGWDPEARADAVAWILDHPI